jgi:hypothetical protein
VALAFVGEPTKETPLAMNRPVVIIHFLKKGDKTMNQIRSTRLVLLLCSVAVFCLFVSGAVMTQNSKEERCRDNKARLDELSNQQDTLKKEASYTNATEAQARRFLALLNRAFADPNLRGPRSPIGTIMEHLRETQNLEDLSLTWKDEYERDDDLFMRVLRDATIRRIERIKYVLANKPAIEQRKASVDYEVNFRRGRLAELGCDATSLKREDQGVSGVWNFECCEKHYTGKLTLIQNSNKISGYFGDTSNGTTGEIDGEINGATLTFKRRWSAQTQDYNLTLSPDGNTLTGSFTGDRDTSVGTDVKATRHEH